MPRTSQVQNNKNRLASAFLSSVSKFPDRDALHINGSVFTYSDLMGLAAAIAEQVKEKGPGPRIAIYCTHNALTYAAVLAVTMLGCSYVPLNPGLPLARLREIVGLCQPSLVLTEIPLELEIEQAIIRADKAHGANVIPVSDHGEAYLLFTSGTTGKPKGVPVTHANLSPFFDHFSTFDFNEQDRFIQSFDLSFDVSVMMMFLCWGAGACLYPVPPEGHKPFNVLNCIREHKLSVCALVPSLLSYIEKYLPEMNMRHVRHTFFAGERLTVRHAELWQKACPASRIYNAYGPSEATIVCMAHQFDAGNANRYGSDVPIGKTFAGTDAWLFDEDLNLISDQAGEICLSGAQVISHYLHSQEEERFFTREGKRIYRTGDLGYRDENGELVFAGRVDDQMKINGYRIEPTEIVRAVQSACGRHSEVVAIKSGDDQALVAFVQGDVTPPGINEKLLEFLPAYMIPREFIPLKTFPIGANDKVDKKRLLQLYYERNHT